MGMKPPRQTYAPHSIVLGLLILGSSVSANAATIRVFAASSLTESFREIATQFQKSTGHSVELNFGASNDLRLQIEHGARADLFAPASMEEMDKARKAALTGAPTVFAQNLLVLIVPRKNRGNVKTLGDLARPGLKIVTAHPNVPIGKYTVVCLERMSKDPRFGADFAEKVKTNFVSLETNVKAIAAKVYFEEADAGIVYRSDVTPGLARAVIAFDIPRPFNVMASYPIAVVRTTTVNEPAAAFIQFLLTAQAQATLSKKNFVPPGP